MTEKELHRIIISNPGGLPKGLEPKDFGKYSVTRNSVLASILLRTELIEKLGTGIRRINNALNDAELSNANFEFSRFFAVVFDKNTDLKTTNKTVEKTREKIILLIKENEEITSKILAQKTGITEKGIEYQLNKLKSENIIKRIGADKGGHWEIIK